jgi:hypothetical protein
MLAKKKLGSKAGKKKSTSSSKTLKNNGTDKRKRLRDDEESDDSGGSDIDRIVKTKSTDTLDLTKPTTTNLDTVDSPNPAMKRTRSEDQEVLTIKKMRQAEASEETLESVLRPRYIAAKDYNAGYHNTAFLARMDMLPTARSGIAETFTADQIWVRGVKLSNDRPPTKFGRDGQRSHTVAWTLLRASLQNVANQPLNRVVEIVDALYQGIDLPTTSTAAAAAAEVLSNNIAKILKSLKDSPIRTADDWQQQASVLLQQFVHLYQLSEAATYADGEAVGHGEPTHMATLQETESAIQKGGKLSPAELNNALDAAVSLTDVKMRLGPKVIGQVAHHWLTSLYLAYPLFMAQYHDQALAAFVKKVGFASLDELISRAGHDPSKIIDAITTKDNSRQVLSSYDLSFGMDAEHQSTFVANIGLTPLGPGASADLEVGMTQNKTLAKKDTLPITTYKLSELSIHHLDVADDRPDTRFGALQRSHTVAWTLVRRHLIALGGQGASKLATFMLNELAILKTDIDSTTAADTAASLETMLKQIVDKQTAYPLHQWQAMLSELVESYVTLYQLSRSATYAKEERPKGHGESQAIKDLTLAETYLGSDKKDKPLFIKANKAHLVEVAVKLVDAVVATGSLKPENWGIAIAHWLHLLEDKFPKLMADDTFKKAIKDSVSVAEPKNETLASYDTRQLSVRDKLLINLVEDVKAEIASVPLNLAKDLKSSMRLRFAKYSPPNSDDWYKTISGLTLPPKYEREWNKNLQKYLRNPPRKIKLPIPDGDNIQAMLKDVNGYLEAVRKSKNELIEDAYERLQSKAHDDTTKQFLLDNADSIKKELDAAIDDAIGLSVLVRVENYQNWFDIVHAIQKDQKVNYENLMAIIKKQGK